MTDAQADAISTAQTQQATQVGEQLKAAFFHGISQLRIENGTFVQNNKIVICKSAFDSIKNSSSTYRRLANSDDSGTTVSLVIFDLPNNPSPIELPPVSQER